MKPIPNGPAREHNGLRDPSRRSAVAPFVALDIFRAALEAEARGEKIIHMEVGQPGAPAPGPVLAAAAEGIREGRIGYTESLGLRSLRTRIARHYADAHGVDVDPGRIVITTGSSAGFNLVFLATFDAGDRVAVAAPGYPAYRNILAALGIEAVEIPTTAETRHVITPELLETAHRARRLSGLLVASPANPSGTMMTPEALAELIGAAENLGIRFISDEIYHGLVYEGRAETALRISDDAVVVNSFSKYYCMTGWRVGWLVLPEQLVRPVERLAQSLYVSPPSLSQRAAIAAFEATKELEAVKAGYAANRQLLLDRLPRIGFDDYFPVDGGFYIYASVRRFTNDSSAFAARMLTEVGVAATPGIDFDPDRGHGFMRFSFAGRHEDMVEATERLQNWLK